MSLPEVILRVREMNRRSDNLVLLAAMEFLKTPVSENNVELQTSLREVLSKRFKFLFFLSYFSFLCSPSHMFSSE